LELNLSGLRETYRVLVSECETALEGIVKVMVEVSRGGVALTSQKYPILVHVQSPYLSVAVHTYCVSVHGSGFQYSAVTL
jgi:hypothetical protein